LEVIFKAVPRADEHLSLAIIFQISGSYRRPSTSDLSSANGSSLMGAVIPNSAKFAGAKLDDADVLSVDIP